MALVDGGKQRAISLDYPVYYSPGACLDILNGFMADAGDPALGGGGLGAGGVRRGFGAISWAAGAVRGGPEGTSGGERGDTQRGSGSRGETGRGEGRIALPPSSGSGSRGRFCQVLLKEFWPPVQSLWESGAETVGSAPERGSGAGAARGRGCGAMGEEQEPSLRDLAAPAAVLPGPLGPRSVIS